MLVVFRDFGILPEQTLSDWSMKKMTIDVFWQRIESAMMMLHKKLEREEREKQEMLDELPW
jgi:hypothetical protein